MWRNFKNLFQTDCYAESRKIRCLFKRVLGAVPRRLCITSSDKVVFKKSMTVCFKYFFGISIKEDKKKENRLYSEELL